MDKNTVNHYFDRRNEEVSGGRRYNYASSGGNYKDDAQDGNQYVGKYTDVDQSYNNNYRLSNRNNNGNRDKNTHKYNHLYNTYLGRNNQFQPNNNAGNSQNYYNFINAQRQILNLNSNYNQQQHQRQNFNNFNGVSSYYDNHHMGTRLFRGPYQRFQQQNFNLNRYSPIAAQQNHFQGNYKSYYNNHINFSGGRLTHVPGRSDSDITSFEVQFDSPGVFSGRQPVPADNSHGTFEDNYSDGSFILGYGVVTP